VDAVESLSRADIGVALQLSVQGLLSEISDRVLLLSYLSELGAAGDWIGGLKIEIVYYSASIWQMKIIISGFPAWSPLTSPFLPLKNIFIICSFNRPKLCSNSN